MKYALLGLATGLVCLSCYLALAWYQKKFSSSRQPTEKEQHRDKGLTDYSCYRLKPHQHFLYTCQGASVLICVTYIFYHSLLLSLAVTPLALFYPKLKAEKLNTKRRRELSIQFRDTLYSLASSLMAGKSVEMAFKDVRRDLRLLYPDPQTPMLREIEIVICRLEMNEKLEDVLSDLARRAHLDDLDSFVDVFVISKRSGGNMVEIIRNTSAVIADKLQIKEEIATLLAQRQLEQRILAIMPAAMILLLSWATGDYMRPVFTTWTGRMAMTAAVLLLAAANLLAQKIMNIEV